MKARGAILGLLLTAVLLALAMREVKFAELGVMLAQARWPWVAVLAAVSVTDLTVRALRWRLLLSRAKSPPPAAFLLFRLEAIGLAINNILPARIGELARAFLAGRELALPLATALSSVAVERALDVTALLTLFCAAAWALPGLVEDTVLKGAALALGGAVAAVAALAFAEERLESGHPWERRLRALPKLHELICELAAGAAVLRQGRPAAMVATLSLLLWAVDAFGFWAGSRALGLGEFVDYPRAVLVLSWAGAAAAIPTAPGGFGSFELAVQTILKRLGATAPQALGYALFIHMVMYLVVTALGLAFLARLGLSAGELKAALERSRK